MPEPAQVPDVTLAPDPSADSADEVDRVIPSDLRDLYEVYSYRHAATILDASFPAERDEIFAALRAFRMDVATIRKSGGNESDIPKQFSQLLRPKGWSETRIRGDLIVKRETHVPPTESIAARIDTSAVTRPNFIDGHKIDYVKGRVAFDLEWNSKDQTFDRDLYAMNAFAACNITSVGVLVTRGIDLNDVFDRMGAAIENDGRIKKKKNGRAYMVKEKFGASTTWIGKLLYRLNAGRNGACPILAFGMKRGLIVDWREYEQSLSTNS